MIILELSALFECALSHVDVTKCVNVSLMEGGREAICSSIIWIRVRTVPAFQVGTRYSAGSSKRVSCVLRGEEASMRSIVSCWNQIVSEVSKLLGVPMQGMQRDILLFPQFIPDVLP